MPANTVSKFHTVVKHGFNIVAVSNKLPITKWKQYQRQPQTDQERNEQLELLRSGKAHAIGLVCGIGGLVNIDIDAPDKDNPQTPPITDDIPRAILAKLNIPWPYAWAWRSASGKGWHIWLLVKDLPDKATREENNKPSTNTVKAIEVRAWGHYSMVPSSVTLPEEPPASVSWAQVLSAVGLTQRAPLVQSKPNKSTDRLAAEAQEKFDLWCYRVLTVENGNRNNTLNKAAFELGRYVGVGVLDEAEVRTRLFESATKRKEASIPEREALATIESGVEAGKKEPPKSRLRSHSLVDLALEKAELFVNQFNIPYARVIENGHNEYKRVESSDFEEWLSGIYYDAVEGQSAPGSELLKNTVRLLKVKAKRANIQKGTHTRIAPDGNGGVYIDMCDSTWRAIHVTSEGWEIVDDVPVAFIRSASMDKLPEPKRGGSLEALRSFINIGGDESWALIKAWLTAALLPTIPHPVLVLVGEQGSAKSTTVEFLRHLIDPSQIPLRRPPHNQEALFIAAKSCWVVTLDNVSAIPDWLSDDICSLVTGSGIAKRKLYTDDDESVMYAKRPFVLNGITEFIRRGDLLDRALLVEVPYIPDRKRKDKTSLEAAFENQRPYILGALLDRLVGALRERPHTQLKELPRMADFALYAVSAEKAELGDAWSEETSVFLKAYRAVRDTAKEQMFEGHVIGHTLLAWLRETPLPWENTASVLLKELENKASEKNDRSVRTLGWPSTPRALRDALQRLKPALRGEGYTVIFTRKHKGRLICIDKENNNDNNDNNDLPPTNDPGEPTPYNNLPYGLDGTNKNNACGITQQQHNEAPGDQHVMPLKNSAVYSAEQRITWLETAHDVEEAMRDIMVQPTVGLDFETTGIYAYKDRIRLVQIATPTNVYILDAFKTDVHLLDKLFAVEEGPVLAGHNLKFELMFLRRAGNPIPNSNRLFDTMIASRVVTAGLKEKAFKKTKQGDEEEKEKRLAHGLDDVVRRYVGKTVDKTLQKSDWSGDLSLEQIQYAANDAALLLPLSAILGEKVYEADLTTVFELEMRALPAVAWMEDTGVYLDVEEWKKIASNNQKELERLDEELTALVGKKMNWRSSKQVLPLLNARGIPVENTQEDTLKPYAATDPFVAVLLNYKKVEKRLGAFGLGILDFVGSDSRIHPNFDQTGTATGRMSCRNPNVQQIPHDDEYRKLFRAPSGRVLIKADYSQIELRIAAEIAKDPQMLKAYKTGQDLHTLTAHLVMGVPLKDVDKEHRRRAKALNFGLIYGMGAKGLRNYAATQYGVNWTEEQAQEFRSKFFRAYQGLRRWHDRVKRNVGAETILTLSGRRRLGVDKLTEKLNTPVQGTGADGLKAALALLWEGRDTCPSAVPVLAVHDEIVLECDLSEAEKAKEWLEDCMKRGMAQFLRTVPVEVEAVIAKDWAGTPVDSYPTARR